MTDSVLRGIDLTGASLARATLCGADFTGSTLKNVSLKGAQVDEASFAKANLRGASLEDAHGLIPSQLADADLTRCILPSDVAEFSQLENVKEVTKNAGALFLATVLASLFVLITAFGTRDITLLTNNGTAQLPLLNATVETRTFFAVAPLVLIVLFVAVHLYLHRLWSMMGELPWRFPDGVRVDRKTCPWLLNELIVRPRRLTFTKDPESYSALPMYAALCMLAYGLVPLSLVAVALRCLQVRSFSLNPFFASTAGAMTVLGVTTWRLHRRAMEREGSWSPWTCLAVGAALISFLPALPSLLVKSDGSRCPWFRLFATLPLGSTVDVSQDRSLRPEAWSDPPAVSTELSEREKRQFETGAFDRYVDRVRGELKAESVRIVGLQRQFRPPSFVGQASAGTTDLRSLSASGSFLANAVFTKADLTGADLSRCDLTGANLSSIANLDDEVSIASDKDPKGGRTNLTSVSLKGAVLRGASLEGDLLTDARFEGGELTNAILRHATLKNANFDRAILAGAALDSAHLEGASLSGASLTCARLTNAKMKEAQLDGARLYGAQMQDADCSGANFLNASLAGANVERTVFFEADLSQCDLRCENLQDAKLDGALFGGSGGVNIIHFPQGWKIDRAKSTLTYSRNNSVVRTYSIERASDAFVTLRLRERG